MFLDIIFAGGINPHHYCLPVLKREPHRRALVKAATYGNSKFFFGTDTAPHSRAMKERCSGSAGMYTADAALELYAEAFDAAGAIDKLEALPILGIPGGIPARPTRRSTTTGGISGADRSRKPALRGHLSAFLRLRRISIARPGGSP